MSDKHYIGAQDLLEDSFRLGAQIIKDGFRPSFIIAIWRGGTPMGIAVQELFAWFGIETDHIAIRTSSYQGIDGRSDEIRIHGMNYLIQNCCQEDRLLIVDDVFDTGITIQSVIAHLRDKARMNTPEDIRVAVPYYKPTRNKTDNQQTIFLTAVLNQVVHAAIGSTYCDMVGFHAEVLQAFLDIDSHGRATPPHADNKIRTKTARINFYCQPIGIFQ